MKFSKRLLVAALVALGALVCGAAWALSSAVGASPDDHFHQTSIWCAADFRCAPVPGDEVLVRVPYMVGAASCYAGNNQVSAECQRALKGDVDTWSVNRGEYPGGYYRFMSLFVGERVGVAVVTMRLVNVLIAVILFTALALSGTRDNTRLQMYALSCTLVPMGWFTLASVNPSSWAVTGVTVFGFALHSLFVVRRQWKVVANGALAILGTALGVSARGDAAVYVVVVTAAVGLLHWRALRARPKLLVVPAVCWLLAVLSALSAGQLGGIASAAPQSDRTRVEVVVTFLVEFPQLISGLFGYGAMGLGWFDTFQHSITAFSVVTVVGFMAIFGASRGSWSKTLAVLVLGGAMLAFPAWTLYRARLIPGESVSPRYLLPVVPVLLGLILTGRKPWRALRLSRAQAWIVWALMTVAHGVALYNNTRRYVTGTDDPIIMDHVEWWWSGVPSPYVTCTLGAIGFAVFAATIIPLSHARPVSSGRTSDETRRRPAQDDAEPASRVIPAPARGRCGPPRRGNP